MTGDRLNSLIKRKTIVTGHYGSGKTEFSVSLAIMLAGKANPFDAISLIDLDIVNPYFRSREKRELLKEYNISVFGSVYDSEIAAELPALGANIRAPLESNTTGVIIDTGGNDTGALVLNQFTKYFTDDDTAVFAVVNANRPDTSDIKTIIEHITSIEKITNLNVDGLINNTHMLRETTAADIIYGNELCEEVCRQTGKYLLCNCFTDTVCSSELTGCLNNLIPLGLYMRPTWLDI